MATVVTYSLKKDGEKSLSKNFKVKEFRCHDGSDKILVCPETVEILQAIRDYFGKPVNISSAYRTPTHNKKVGGATKSQHVVGTACDIKVQDVPPSAVAGFLESKFPNHGIGMYTTFTHVDSRGRKTYWKYTGNNVCSSFAQGSAYTKYKSPTAPTFNESSWITLKLKDTGVKVSEVQSALKSKGYSVGTVDGIFGNKTETAVKQFQKDNSLTVDGIVGKQTAKKLFV